MAHAPRLAAIMADHDRGPEYALVQCIGADFTCPSTERVEASAGKTDVEIVAILAERDWSVGPTLCPAHREASSVEAARHDQNADAGPASGSTVGGES